MDTPINSGGGDQIYDLVWDDQLGLPQLTRLDTPTNSYGFANGAGRSFAVDATGSVETFTLDALGNTIAGPSELVRADWYWADGPANPNAPPTPISFGHKSELTVGDTLYLRARNPDLDGAARFLTTDPLPGEAGTAVQTNPYHYANNNPIAFSDPSGMRPFGDTTLQWAYARDANGRGSSLIRPSYVNSPADMAEYLGSYADQTGIIKTSDGYFAPIGDIWDAAVDIGPATYIEGALDLAGMVPAVGNFADGAAIAFYLAQDDFINAAISVFGLLPVIGQAVVLARGEIAAKAAIDLGPKPFTNIVDAKNWIKESFQKLFNKVPGGLPVSPGRFADDTFYDVVRTSAGDVEVLAEVSISGRTLTISDLAIYGADGDLVNQVGASTFIGVRDALATEAAEAGFETLRVTGLRVGTSSSANPGHVIDRVIDLARFRR